MGEPQIGNVYRSLTTHTVLRLDEIQVTEHRTIYWLSVVKYSQRILDEIRSWVESDQKYSRTAPTFERVLAHHMSSRIDVDRAWFDNAATQIPNYCEVEVRA